jgi:hypothetical protein
MLHLELNHQICYSDFLEAVVERQDASAGGKTVTLLDKGSIDIIRIYSCFMECDEDNSG